MWEKSEAFQSATEELKDFTQFRGDGRGIDKCQPDVNILKILSLRYILQK